MITLQDWQVAQAPSVRELLAGRRFSRIVRGTVQGVDERSRFVSRFLDGQDSPNSYIQYSCENSRFLVDQQEVRVADFASHEVFEGNILVDANSLEFPELVFIFRAASRSNIGLSCLYVEPSDYTQAEGAAGELKHRFDLSVGDSQIDMLPLYVRPTAGADVVVALGFEGHRFQAIFNSDEYSGSKFRGIIGVPAFQPGWENRTYCENARAMEQALTTRSEFETAGANDPRTIYQVLERMLRATQSPVDDVAAPLLLAPFGTKPMSIAFAWFVANKEDGNIGVLYDFVARKRDQSAGLGKIHLWSFRGNS